MPISSEAMRPAADRVLKMRLLAFRRRRRTMAAAGIMSRYVKRCRLNR
ncbi:hypothetical protein KCP74_17605 [Salmonella enterica subsp. enterica]|nr:hypothetical protein KCP74_17605 [Salmonella enterica subsp. enterica]